MLQVIEQSPNNGFGSKGFKTSPTTYVRTIQNYMGLHRSFIRRHQSYIELEPFTLVLAI